MTGERGRGERERERESEFRACVHKVLKCYACTYNQEHKL